MEYVTDAWLVPVSVTWLTFEVAVAASGFLDCALITVASTCPSWSSASRRETVVLALKKVAQLALIAEMAPAPVVGSADPVAGAEDVGGAVGPVVLVLVLPDPPLLLQAASASPIATSSDIDTMGDSRKCRRCIATVCRTNGDVNHDVDDSPEIFRRIRQAVPRVVVDLESFLLRALIGGILRRLSRTLV